MLEEYSTIKVIQEIVSNPTKVYTLRGLAKISGASKGSVAKALEFMQQRKMISLTVVGQTHQYQVILENPLTRQWKALFNLEEINKVKLVEEILVKVSTVRSVLLYGSMAKGTNDKNSDVDLLVIAEQATKSKPSLGKALKREPNVMILNFKEWKALAQKDKVFYDNAIIDSIALHGRKPVIL